MKLLQESEGGSAQSRQGPAGMLPRHPAAHWVGCCRKWPRVQMKALRQKSWKRQNSVKRVQMANA
eukprot:6468157-Amphidinium_carterae.1